MASPPEILLTTSLDTSIITAYDPSSGTILAHFTNTHSPRKSLTLAGPNLLAATHISSSPLPTSFIHLYTWSSCTPLHRLPLPEPVAPITSTLDSLHLFCGGASGYVHTLSLPSGTLLRSFPAHPKPVSCFVVNHDMSFLVSGGEDGSICVFPLLQIFDLATEVRPLYWFSAHASSVTAVTTGCGGTSVVSCLLDCTCKFWSLARRVVLIRSVEFSTMLWCLALDSNESGFYVGGSDGRVYYNVVKVRSRRPSDAEVVEFDPPHDGAVIAVAMVNEERNLVSGSEDGVVRIWDVEGRSVVRVVANGAERVGEVVVVRGFWRGGGGGGGGGGFGEGRWGYCVKEMSTPVRELSELEESLEAVVKDRRKAVEILEGTIETYQRLLGLLLKEAQGGSVCNNESL